MQIRKLVLLSIICLCAGFSAAQSLGEVAKQKPAKKATRVITNDEIPSRPPEEETTKASVTEAETAANEAKPAREPDKEPEKEANSATAPATQMSPEVQDMEKQLADLNTNIAARQKRTDEYREKLRVEEDDSRREVQKEVLEGMERDLKSMQKESDDLQKKIDDKKQAEKEKPKETEAQ
jgi:hypothetical protein